MIGSSGSRCSEVQCRDYLSQIAVGNETALEELYRMFSRPIFLFAMSYCRQRETAEDIVSRLQLCVSHILSLTGLNPSPL